MQGNEACAQGAVDAGVRFFAGYPITPSTEIAENMAKRMPKLGGKFIQMEDEIASISAVIGASLTGARAMTATSGPGFSLMQENIGYACMTEVPCLIVNVQRGGPSTGRPTAPAQGDVMQARWGTHGDHPSIVLSPWSVHESYSLTVKAVNLAESLRTPVILLLDEVIAHLREGVSLPDPRKIMLHERPRPAGSREEYRPFGGRESDVPPIADFGMGYSCNFTGLVHDEVGHPTNSPEIMDDLKEIYFLRSLLEGTACQLAANNISEQSLEELERLCEKMEKCLSDNDLTEMPKYNSSFHRTIYAAANSPRLYKMIVRLWNSFLKSSFSFLTLRAPVMVNEHKAVYKALRGRNPEEAMEKMREHLLSAYGDLSEYWNQRLIGSKER